MSDYGNNRMLREAGPSGDLAEAQRTTDASVVRALADADLKGTAGSGVAARVIQPPLRRPLMSGDPASVEGVDVSGSEGGGTITIAVPATAPTTSYAPNDLSDWPSPPATVQEALDDLADEVANSSGGGGGTSDVDVYKQDFTFASLSPLNFGSLAAGSTIIDADVTITTPFDDPSAIVTLGQASNTGNLLDSGGIDPTQQGTYSNDADLIVSGVDALRLQIVPGASTQGAGRAVVTVRRP